MYHICFIHSSVDGHLGCFHDLPAFVFYCYTVFSGLILFLLSWAILTLQGKVKDRLTVPVTVRARCAVPEEAHAAAPIVSTIR